jgi:hypothetical protein
MWSSGPARLLSGAVQHDFFHEFDFIFTRILCLELFWPQGAENMEDGVTTALIPAFSRFKRENIEQGAVDPAVRNQTEFRGENRPE